MKYCRFCGKELVNGRCDCEEFLESMGESGSQEQETWHQDNTGEKAPFLAGPFRPDFRSVSAFISSIRDYSGMSEPNSENGDPYEHNVPIVPECVEQEDNETIVKQYNIAILRSRLKFMKAEGRLMVTTRRVLFRAAGTSLTGNILQEHQFNLDEIGGIEMHKDYKFSILNFLGSYFIMALAILFAMVICAEAHGAVWMVLGLLLGFAFTAPTFVVYKRFWIKLFTAMAGPLFFLVAYVVSDGNGFLAFLLFLSAIIVLVNVIIVCFVPNLVIKIKTKGAAGAVVIGSQKAMFQRKTGDDYTGFSEVLPWEDTLKAMNEIGTMIDDLQKNGDYAASDWIKQ